MQQKITILVPSYITTLASSASGRVYTARDRRNGQIVAVKRMAFESQPKKELLLTEIKVMQKYKHEVGSVGFHAYFTTLNKCSCQVLIS